MNIRLKFWLRAIRVLVWISILGFSITLFNSVRLAIGSNTMRAEVNLQKADTLLLTHGSLELSSGVYSFKSTDFIDRLIFRHTYENWDFIQSLFSLISCCLLLFTVNGINAESPFTLKVAKRIAAIGVVYIAYGLINIGFAFYIQAKITQLENHLSLHYFSFPADLSYIKSGVFILIFSFIYRVGVSYQEENQLTV
ncbi:MAG: hypothetical protein M3O71_23865 [Bacteroidota bacterium]|nr:hypothetical protein [Bacteroidota bacterium]